MSGFVAREDQWKKANNLCLDIFERAKMPYLHMAEFVSDKSSLYADVPYAHRSRVIRRLMTAVRRNIPLAVTVSVDESDFESATSTRFRSQIGTAYTICAMSAVMLVGSLLAEEDIDLCVDWTFEQGHPNMGQLAQRLTVLHEAVGLEFRIRKFGFNIPSPGIAPDVPLQLADALTYAALQPYQSFKIIQHLRGDDDAAILHFVEVPLSPPMIHESWDPIATVEAVERRRRRTLAKASSTAHLLREYENKADVSDGELEEVRKAVVKLNRLAARLGIEGVRLVVGDSDVA